MNSVPYGRGSAEGHTAGPARSALATHHAAEAAHHLLHAAAFHFLHHLLHLLVLLQQAVEILHLGAGALGDAALAEVPKELRSN